MDKVACGNIEMTWHSGSRLAVLRFASETRATGNDAMVLVNALTRWIGTEREPFGLLGDGDRLSAVDAGYRSVWARFLRQHRKDARIALFNMGPLVRIAAEMFRLGTGLRMKSFDNEQGARSWLRRMGIEA